MIKKMILILLLSIALQAQAEWTEYRKINSILYTDDNELLFWLFSNRLQSPLPNPGGCSHPSFKIKAGDPGAEAFIRIIEKAYFENLAIRVNIATGCHDTTIHKRLDLLQLRQS